jgi:hypothetical protein
VNIDKLTNIKAKQLNAILIKYKYDFAFITESNNPSDAALNKLKPFTILNTVKTGNRKGGIVTVFNCEKIKMGILNESSRHQTVGTDK